MKILFIAKNIPLPSYSENDIILKLAAGLEENQVDTQLLYPKELFPSFLSFLSKRMKANSSLNREFCVGQHSIKTVEYIRVFLVPKFEWALSMLPFKVNSSYRPDIIHAHFIFPDLMIAHGLKKEREKIVVTVRQGDLNNIKSSFYNLNLFKKYLAKTDLIIAPSPRIKFEVEKLLENRSTVQVIPNFIDDDFFTFPSIAKEIKHAGEDKIKLICVANLIERKNIDWLINAHRKRANYFDLVIVGSGPELNYLRTIADKSVLFTGRLEGKAIIDKLDESDVFVLPSDNETFGLVYVEAMSRGKPIIGKRGTGLDGFYSEALYFVDDESDLLDALYSLRILLKDNKEQLNLASKRFSENFKKDVVIKKLVNEYKRLL